MECQLLLRIYVILFQEQLNVCIYMYILTRSQVQLLFTYNL